MGDGDGDDYDCSDVGLVDDDDGIGKDDDVDEIDDGDDDGGDTNSMVGNQAVAGLGLVCHKGYVQPVGERG